MPSVELCTIEDLCRSDSDLFSTRRLQVIIVNEQVKDELAFGRWISGSNSLIEIIFKCPLSPKFYSSILPSSCPTLRCLAKPIAKPIYAANLPKPISLPFLLKFMFLYRLDFSVRIMIWSSCSRSLPTSGICQILFGLLRSRKRTN